MSSQRGTYLAALGRWATEQWLDGVTGVPYIFGGKDPDTGLDCSGAVTAAGELAGIWRPDFGLTHNANSLALLLPTVDRESIEPGDLCFYGKPSAVVHVMSWVGDGSSRVVGASGGDHTTTTIAAARGSGACVHYKPTADYRSDLLCFGRLPVTDG